MRTRQHSKKYLVRPSWFVDNDHFYHLGQGQSALHWGFAPPYLAGETYVNPECSAAYNGRFFQLELLLFALLFFYWHFFSVSADLSVRFSLCASFNSATP